MQILNRVYSIIEGGPVKLFLSEIENLKSLRLSFRMARN